MPETHVASGKVRELYALDDDRLLLVASDRISTFDVVLPKSGTPLSMRLTVCWRTPARLPNSAWVQPAARRRRMIWRATITSRASTAG